jgi:hypothetical protein
VIYPVPARRGVVASAGEALTGHPNSDHRRTARSSGAQTCGATPRIANAGFYPKAAPRVKRARGTAQLGWSAPLGRGAENRSIEDGGNTVDEILVDGTVVDGDRAKRDIEKPEQ